jgi:AsmA protein
MNALFLHLVEMGMAPLVSSGKSNIKGIDFMNKPLKYALLGLGGVLVLAVAGAAVFALTFDPNRYKDQVERLAKDKTGRTLKLAGDIKLAFWPSLGADVSKVWLSERDNKTEFLSLDSAHASVKLMPLLKGQAIVDGIRVSGLRANVVKEKDGRFNFSDLLESKEAPGAEPAKKAEPAPQTTEEGGVAFDIAGIRIERAAVAYLDKASGQSLEISDFKLITGRIAEKADGKLELAATVKGKNPDLALKVKLDGGYRVDLPAQSYSVSKLQATIAGEAAGQAIDARLSSPELVVATDKAKGSLNAELKTPDLQANLKLAGIEGSAKALVIPQLTADLTMKNMKIPVHGSVRADLEKQTANAELKAKLDDSNIDAKLGLAKFSPPAYLFDINIDQLNVDKHFPPEQKPVAQAPAPKAPAPQPAGKPAETPLDFGFLKGLNANGQLQIGALQARGLKMANLKAKVRAAGGKLEVNPHSANLYEGSLSGALTVQAEGNRITLKDTLTGVNIGPLLREFAQKDLLEGRGNLVLDVTGGGATVEQLKKSLAGSAKVNLRDGAIKGINLAETVRKARSLFAGGGSAAQGASAVDPNKKTDFSELSASFTIKGGVAHNEDLDVKSPLFRIGGAGDIDIGNSRMDYTTKAAVVATTKGQGGEDLEALRGVTVPVRLSGPFDNLSYDVDFRGMLAGAAKSKLGGEVKERVQERLGERVDEDKIRDKVKDRLKGLLGR